MDRNVRASINVAGRKLAQAISSDAPLRQHARRAATGHTARTRTKPLGLL